MQIPVTVYTNPNCVQCDSTKRQFDKLGIKYSVVALETVPEKLQEFIEQGFKSAPIVTTDTKIWSGFRLEKIKSLHQHILSLNAHEAEQA